MKKIIILFLCIAAVSLSACGNTNSDSDTDFKLLEGDLTDYKFNSPATSYTTNLGSSSSSSKAIIYNTRINGVYYVGIALSNSPDYPSSSETFNLKIIFTGYSSIPVLTSQTLTSAVNGLRILYYNGSTTTDITNNITITISSPTAVTTTNYTHYTYTISGTGTGSLSSFNITAVKAGS